MKETNISRLCQLRASELGHRLFRNQRGRYQTPEGQWVAYGVGPDGASDLIGWTRDGRFAAVEIKRPGEKLRPDQKQFIDLVIAAGGRAGVAYGPEDVEGVLG